ncbi:MAG: 30S ribosomal protein S20 [Candidatus Latescibacterota bacterium]|nr:30S ribosomal protein S20 [Candidatus Latescibacterota bacterium]
MPKLISSKKRLRTSLKARDRNKAALSRMRTAIKNVRSAEDKDSAVAALNNALSVVDSTVRKGRIHRNTGARYKSRLARMVNAID